MVSYIFIKLEDLNFYKIGITSRTISERIKSISKSFKTNCIIIKSIESDLLNCFRLEQKILSVYSNYRVDRSFFFEKRYDDFSGYTEILKLPKRILR